MSSRRYTKRIEVYQIGGTKVSDGFGGYTVTDALLGTSWAKIKTFSAGKFTNLVDYGIVNSQNAIIVECRKRIDLTYNSETQYIKYRNKNYTISTDPVESDFSNRDISFVAVLMTSKSNVAGV